MKGTGDGILATFDGPSRAIRCAEELRIAVRTLGLVARAGVHAGEVERRGDDVTGVGVTVAARVCALADRDEILVSRTLHDLLLGSEIALQHHSTTTLKGLPDTWDLFVVARRSTDAASRDHLGGPAASLTTREPSSRRSRGGRGAGRRAPRSDQSATLNRGSDER